MAQIAIYDAVDRFAEETQWDLHLDGADPPSTLDVAKELPKRGPARLLSRLAFQTAQDKLPF